MDQARQFAGTAELPCWLVNVLIHGLVQAATCWHGSSAGCILAASKMLHIERPFMQCSLLLLVNPIEWSQLHLGVCLVSCAGNRLRALAYHGAAVRDCADLYTWGLLVSFVCMNHTASSLHCKRVPAIHFLPRPERLPHNLLLLHGCMIAHALQSSLCASYHQHADFVMCSCSYYYLKSYAEGSGVIHLAAGIV